MIIIRNIIVTTAASVCLSIIYTVNIPGEAGLQREEWMGEGGREGITKGKEGWVEGGRNGITKGGREEGGGGEEREAGMYGGRERWREGDREGGRVLQREGEREGVTEGITK